MRHRATRKSLPSISVRVPAALLLDRGQAYLEEGTHPVLLGYQLHPCSCLVVETGRETAYHQEACLQVACRQEVGKACPAEEIQLRHLVEREEGTACPEEVGRACWVACWVASLGLVNISIHWQ